MPDVPDVDALELGKRILDIAALNSLPPSAFKEMGALTTQLADLARKATAANARADEAEAVCEWLAEEVAALNSGTVVIYSDGSVMRTAQQWLAAARNAVRETVRDE